MIIVGLLFFLAIAAYIYTEVNTNFKLKHSSSKDYRLLSIIDDDTVLMELVGNFVFKTRVEFKRNQQNDRWYSEHSKGREVGNYLCHWAVQEMIDEHKKSYM